MSLELDLQIVSEQNNLPTDEDISLWLRTFAEVMKLSNGELTVRIVDEKESQTLNHDYRGKDKPTNVLSFPFDSDIELPIPLLGDLIVCAGVVAQEAKEQNKALHEHWAHMIIHGALHLLGYDHINDEEAEEMENLERQILAQLNIQDPYVER
ncbi:MULTISPECIES: rRNA maturation RNase YbeY [Gammaproteobacteria]|uniref:rRNA maturation RNase YbeY n=1 Tax=Gammaproteobacteria TaxID=1236 RepID=UPI000DD006AE|nr:MULTISPECIES: rRNA maturation RNase YbeY [Gammaproteobacteria]RTE87447.1 rRNA maturation RNase YbeY [Aliidiomarina sp. B3213]TCZ92768.1 rRNA maturation RNase YbeY [Lysobacter sp. N42]